MAYTFSANYLKAQETPPPWLRTPYYCQKPLRLNDLYLKQTTNCGDNELYIYHVNGNGLFNTYYLKPVLNGEYTRPFFYGHHAPILEKNDSMFQYFYPYNSNWAELNNLSWNFDLNRQMHFFNDYPSVCTFPNINVLDDGIYNGMYEVTSANPADPDCVDSEPYYFNFYSGPIDFLYTTGPDLMFYGGGSGNYISTHNISNPNNFPAVGDIGYKCHEFGVQNKVGYDYLNFGTKNLVPLKQFWEKKRIGIRISSTIGSGSKEKITLVDFVENCPSSGIGPEPNPDPEGNIALTQSLLACNCNTLPFDTNFASKTVVFKPILLNGRKINVVEKWYNNNLLPLYNLDFSKTSNCQDVIIRLDVQYNNILEHKVVCLNDLKFNINSIQLFFHKLPENYEIKIFKNDTTCMIGGGNED